MRAHPRSAARAQHPEALQTVQAEIDEVLGDRYATVADIEKMPELQKVHGRTHPEPSPRLRSR